MAGLHRLMPVEAAVRTTLSGMLGMHSCAYQLLDDNVSPSYLHVLHVYWMPLPVYVDS